MKYDKDNWTDFYDRTGVTYDVSETEFSMRDKSVENKSSDVEKAYRIIDCWDSSNIIGNHSGTYFYNGKYWLSLTDQELRVRVINALYGLGLKANQALVKSISDIIKDSVFSSDLKFNLGENHIVSFANGDVKWDQSSWQLKDSQPEDYRITRLPVEYNRNATAPLFEDFLNKIFEYDGDREAKIRLVLEMIGYAMQTHAKHELFLILVGSGANGKSVLLNTIRNVLGPENIAAVQPNYFDKSFHRATLEHKLANIVTESEQGGRLPTAQVKAMVSGEPMTVEKKYGHPFVMTPYATLFWATNHVPNARDYSEALFRRARIIEFNRSFSTEDQDIHLTDKLEKEAAGIANLALHYYGEAIQNGFTYPESVRRANKTWKTESDSVASWAEEKLRDCAGHNIKADILYGSYKMWCENSGHQTVSSTMFGRRMDSHSYEKKRLSQGVFYLNKELFDG